jgi:hypothetical protein
MVQGKVTIAPHPRGSELLKFHKGPFVVVTEGTSGDVRGIILFTDKEHIGLDGP